MIFFVVVVFCTWTRNATNSILSSSNSDTPVLSNLGAVCVPGTGGEGYSMHLHNLCPVSCLTCLTVGWFSLEVKYNLGSRFFLREELGVSPLTHV